jgi:hypothetical protein
MATSLAKRVKLTSVVPSHDVIGTILQFVPVYGGLVQKTKGNMTYWGYNCYTFETVLKSHHCLPEILLRNVFRAKPSIYPWRPWIVWNVNL